jgi:excisionase family DNA binding protein
MSDEPLIGSDEASELLGIHRATLLRWVASGRVTAVHQLPGANGAYLFSRPQIVRLAQRRIAAKAEREPLAS